MTTLEELAHMQESIDSIQADFKEMASRFTTLTESAQDVRNTIGMMMRLLLELCTFIYLSRFRIHTGNI